MFQNLIIVLSFSIHRTIDILHRPTTVEAHLHLPGRREVLIANKAARVYQQLVKLTDDDVLNCFVLYNKYFLVIYV